ncbi:MAG: response regulator [Halomonadaceae bacterium]|nr:MAG: response regulator [Halomonadaceae bacterium]
MGNQPDNIALDWVRGEIQETLKQGQQALEGFAEHRDDSARLRFCLNYLHQVHGTLRMVELPGAAMLAGEMESLAQALLNETLDLTDERISILMQGILKLPRYLDTLDSSADDFPLVLLPLLNEFRAARAEPLLSDSTLFSPNLEPARMEVPASINKRLQDPDVLVNLGKLQQMFRFGIKGLANNDHVESHLGYLDKVITRLIRLCQKTPSGELWLAAGAFVDSLKGGYNRLGAATRTLLEELDVQLSKLVNEHVDALQQPLPVPLMKNLLYYVARAAEQDSPRVQTLISRYHLHAAMPSAQVLASARERAAGPDRDAIHSVVVALGEELTHLKDQLDLFVRNKQRHNRDLEELLPGLHQVANTLSLLSLTIPREVAMEQAQVLETLIASEAPADDGSLMDIAGALLYVESALFGLEQHQQGDPASLDKDASPYTLQQLGEANTALLREARNSLEQVKTAVVNFIASQWDTNEIHQVPALLHSIRGGLQLVPLEQAASMLLSCERFVQEALLEGQFVPDLAQLDTLADAITSIEYFLERMAEGIRDNDAVLRVAEESLVALGFPPGQDPTWQRSEEPVPTLDQPVTEPTPKAADRDLVDDEILEIFVEEAHEVMESIHTNLPLFREQPQEQHPQRELRRAFHTLKGSGRLVSATSIGELAWAVENLLNRVLEGALQVSNDMFRLLEQVIQRLPELVNEFSEGHSDGDVSDLISACNALTDSQPPDTDQEPGEDTHGPLAATPEASTTESTEPPVHTEQAEQTDHTDEPAPAATPVAEAADEEDDLIDEEILDIFIEEAEEVLHTIREQLPALHAHYDNANALTEIRRAFHTLKGSGRMVNASVIAELAWSMENLLNRVMENQLFMNQDIAGLLQQASDETPVLVEDFRHRRTPSVDTQPMRDRAAALARGEQPDSGAMPADENPQPADHSRLPLALTQEDDDSLTDPLLLDIFRSEAETHLQTLSQFLGQAEKRQHMAYSDDLSRALHTLKGSAHTAGIAPIATVATPMERYVKAARDQNLSADKRATSLLQRLLDFIRLGLDQLQDAPLEPLAGTEEFLQDLEQLSRESLRHEQGSREAPHNPLLHLFSGDGLDHLLEADRLLQTWADAPEQDHPAAQQLQPELQQLETRARELDVSDVADLAHALVELHHAIALSGSGPDEDSHSALQQGHDTLINMLDQVAAGLGTQPDSDLLHQLSSLSEAMEQRRNQAREQAFDEQFGGDLDRIDQRMDEGLSLDHLSWQQESPPTSDSDPSMLAIFLEESEDLLQHSAQLVQQYELSPDNQDLLRQCQRDMQTLAEAAALAALAPIEQLARELENLLAAIYEGTLSCLDSLPVLLQGVQHHLMEQVTQVRENTHLDPGQPLLEALAAYRQQGAQAVSLTQVPEEDSLASQQAALAQQASDQQQQEAATSSHKDQDQAEPLDPEMVEIFLEEARELILSTGDALHQWLEQPQDRALAATLQRELHTLKGGARMAAVTPMGDLGHILEDLFERVVDGRQDASGQDELLYACHDALARMVEQLGDDQPLEDPAPLINQVKALLAGKAAEPQQDLEQEQDLDLSAYFLEEAREIQGHLSEQLEDWQDPESLQQLSRLQEELQSLHGGARLASQDAVAELAQGWSQQLNRVLEGYSNPQQAQQLSQRCLSELGTMLDALEADETPQLPANLWPDSADTEQPVTDAAQDTQELDPEVLAIFQEEARELVDALDNCLAAWKKGEGENHNAEAQRLLHTLKGGARLAGVKDLGDQAHAFESQLMALPAKGPKKKDWATMAASQEAIVKLVDAMEAATQSAAEAEPLPPVAAPTALTPAAPTPAESAEAEAAAAQGRAGRKVAARARRQAAQTRAQQETVRVNAQLLEELVNLAGETSITRGRMEQQISDFSQTLEEMSATTERLREQLRRMEIETETQILFRAEQEMGTQYDEDFDPLEMDRYSAIQQLSRALTESASDLTDLRETMSDKVRDAETLLLQQSRTNTELQEGLMKTRMIPFSAMVPRLRRIVRQITGELDKQAEFEVLNAEGEMDRTVLERMIAPLEHMLRNALDHGIEDSAGRLAAGKPEAGQVTLSLSREGGEIVLRLQDDGAGIAIDRVREKAISQNLLAPSEELSDREVLQFILQPGFSTAAAVTQISGRGVGMDVVASEIKQVGGSLDIDSKVGEGTTFTVRLPFTVSVNRALMVTTGEDYYAIPLNTIEGIVRVSTWELEEFYQPDAPLYEYAGQNYRLQYLGSLLNSEHQPKLQGQALPLPVILVRGDEQPMALQVDSLLGSREIVVKSLGPQFNTVRGVSGATILGDGNVVVILDLPAMIRADILSQRQRMLTQLGDQRSRREERATLVMVVDDSVTVRKVTSRLLERNGMDVLLAKDGLDAVAQLQDHTPDVILLDIEMPRMDGFEVASFVRHDSRLRNIPIIMITSRTGDKHRERAMAIGVNEYLGKPFQEQELLETLMRTVKVEA